MQPHCSAEDLAIVPDHTRFGTAKGRMCSARLMPVMQNESAAITDIAAAIALIRGHRVILDADLALLYGVSTKRLNEQVKRNIDRFPTDFVFRLSGTETAELNRSQNATGSQKHRDPRYPPFAFTEHGAIMAAMVLNSPLAVEMSVYVVRAFVQLKDAIRTSAAFAEKFRELENRLDGQDAEIAAILEVLRALMAPPETRKLEIGFLADHGKR